jgi:hypothetical protein
MSAAYRTVHPRGFLPAGMTVEVIKLSLTGGARAGRPGRDAHLSDGTWIIVRHPNGIGAGEVRIPRELAELEPGDPALTEFIARELAGLGIDLADLALSIRIANESRSS